MQKKQREKAEFPAKYCDTTLTHKATKCHEIL